MTGDANWNVLGLVDRTGVLIGRYEYSPYGQRKVFSRGWLLADMNDDGAVDISDSGLLATHWQEQATADSRWDLDGSGTIDIGDYGRLATEWSLSVNRPNDPQLYAVGLSSYREPLVLSQPLCQFGHQGLMHDEESGLVYNRARMLDPTLGRFVQRDSLGYQDGLNLHAYLQSQPIGHLDPLGLESLTVKVNKAFFGTRVLGCFLLTIPNHMNDNYEFYDSEREMWGQLNGNMLDFYSKYLGTMPLSREWQLVDVSANAPSIAPSPGGAYWTVTGKAFTWGFWLGSSSIANAQGFLRARCASEDTIEIKSVNVRYDWIDRGIKLGDSKGKHPERPHQASGEGSTRYSRESGAVQLRFHH